VRNAVRRVAELKKLLVEDGRQLYERASSAESHSLTSRCSTKVPSQCEPLRRGLFTLHPSVPLSTSIFVSFV